MTSLYATCRATALEQVAKRGLKCELDITQEEALEKVTLMLLEKECLRALTIGIAPSYDDWCGMVEQERKVWEDSRVEIERGRLGVQAALAGNLPMANAMLNADDDSQRRFAAMELAFDYIERQRK